MRAENKPLWIADASILLKWILEDEKDLEIALSFREDLLRNEIQVRIPPHALSELGNILGRKKPEAALPFLSAMMNAGIPIQILSIKVIALALTFMRKHKKITFYDAAYHALAIQEKGTFLTADKQYYLKMRAEGHICLLRDYPASRPA